MMINNQGKDMECFKESKEIGNRVQVLNKEDRPLKMNLKVEAESLSNDSSVEDIGPIKRGKGSSGRWTKAEHEKFLKAVKVHGKSWKTVQKYIGTRSATQVRSHAQKYFLKNSQLNDTSFQEMEQESPNRTRANTPMMAPMAFNANTAQITKPSGCLTLILGEVQQIENFKKRKINEIRNNCLISYGMQNPPIHRLANPTLNLPQTKIQEPVTQTSVVFVKEPFSDPDFEDYMRDRSKNCDVSIIPLQNGSLAQQQHQSQSSSLTPI
jgi:SHAQKYF class myb-like DNA-binding protein